MNDQLNINKIYFIGIGGIGMSALARYFHAKNVSVSGYDKTVTQLTKQLEQEGIVIHYEENVNIIPKDVDAVVYTPAIPVNHAELMYYQQHGYKVMKRSDILQWISNNTFNICVAGTHGKTTTSSMIAHILRATGYGCNAFLGGIAANYQTNFWSHPNNVVVVEADEYDRSFLKLSPSVAIITAMDADHLDIYGTAEEVEKAFLQFADKLQPNGLLIHKYGLKRAAEFSATKQTTYSTNEPLAANHITNLQVIDGAYQFDVVHTKGVIENVVLNMGGIHNIENALAAIVTALYLNIDEKAIKEAVASFKGVRRRFEYHLKTTEIVMIDDYAHHPEELKALIDGVRSLYPQKKMTLVFQPHLYSRTNDLAVEFAQSLNMADEVLLLPIYPARELPIPGVSNQTIASKMQQGKVACIEKNALLNTLTEKQPELVVMAGAGDIDTLLPSVKQMLEKLYNK